MRRVAAMEPLSGLPTTVAHMGSAHPVRSEWRKVWDSNPR